MGVKRTNKRSCYGLMACFLIGLMGLIQADCFAQSSKKVGQLNFQLPEDWPVEKRGGLVTPIPTEEYVSIKFKEIEGEFQTIKDEFTKKFSDLDSDLGRIEEDLSKEINSLRSQNADQGEAVSSLADITSSVELIKSELARLDRKITNKIREVQAKLDQINPQIEYIKENLNGLQTQIYGLDEKIDYLEEDQLRSR